MPEVFLARVIHEPAFDAQNCTFCIWRLDGDEKWSIGDIVFSAGDDPDGSADLLTILEGRPEQYAKFATEYFEKELSLEDVRAVYNHQPLTPELVQRLNPSASLKTVRQELVEIGYE